MGQLSSAFLVYQNFQIYLEWNDSLIYSTTAAYLASRIPGAPFLHSGKSTAGAAFCRCQSFAGHAGPCRL
jgi:hypothetical protein